MTQKPTTPYQPYADLHRTKNGPGDARPTAMQVVKDCDAFGKLKGKTILITGCSAGMGVETARALYETGAQIFMTARDMPKLDKIIEDIVSKSESKGFPRPEPLELHLDSLAKVRAGAEDFKRRSSRLDILITNAGVMAAPYSTTEDGFELQLGTNHYAHFLLFQLLKSLLLSSTPSRVVCLSSSGHRRSPVRFDDIDFSGGETYDRWLAYGQSKTANIYMASSITRHYGSQGLIGLSVHPGVIWTDLGRHLSQEDIDAMGLESDPAMTSTMRNPEQGAATTVWAAISTHFDRVENGGRFLADVGECGPYDPNDTDPGSAGYGEHAYDEVAGEKLWRLSYEKVGLKAEE